MEEQCQNCDRQRRPPRSVAVPSHPSAAGRERGFLSPAPSLAPLPGPASFWTIPHHRLQSRPGAPFPFPSQVAAASKTQFLGLSRAPPRLGETLGKLAALLPAAGWCCGRCASVCARGRVGKGGSQRHAQAATSRQEKESGSFKCVSERRSAGQRATAGEASAVGARLSYLSGSEFSGKQRHRVCCGRPEDSIGVSIGDKGGEEVFGRAGKGKAGAPGPTSQGITARSCTPKPCGI